jgi:SMC interacting uncharacterized protein involved in chromosome segregation
MSDYDYDPSIWTKESITIDGLKNIIGELSKTIARQAQTIAHLKKQNDELRELSARKDRVGISQVELLKQLHDELKAKDARITELEAAGQRLLYSFEEYLRGQYPPATVSKMLGKDRDIFLGGE